MADIFKKEDFLTANQVAKKFGYEPAAVALAMKRLRLKQATIRLKSGAKDGTTVPREIISERMGGHKLDRVHPLGLDILIGILDQEKVK